MIIEGYMLKYANIIWAVKGCFHPEGYAVAVPRVYKGKKIKKMSEALKIVKEKFPFLLRYVPEIGFKVPLVPLKDAIVLDPFSKEVVDELPRRFISYFKGRIGVTGSLLYSNEYNDIDLLSFDESHYITLKELREKGITSPLNKTNLDEIEILEEEDFRILKEKRVLEGVYKGKPYTFKIVKCVDFGYVMNKEEFKGVIKITKAIKPYSLPVIYLTDLGYYLTSFRIRFAELKEGISLYVIGTLLKRDKFLDLDLDIAKEVKLYESRP